MLNQIRFYTAISLVVLIAPSFAAAQNTAPGKAAPAAIAEPEPDSASSSKPAARTQKAAGSAAQAGQNSQGGQETTAGAAIQANENTKLETMIRGFYIGFDAGFGFLPLKMNDVAYLPGGNLSLTIGYDISDSVTLQSALFYNAFGSRKGQTAHDLSLAGGKVALLFTAWNSGPLLLQAGAGGGFLILDDALTIPFEKSPMADALGSIEYYTGLRHFSIGASFDLQFIFTPFNINTQIMPHIRYTF
jgi:hypothetical protein